MADFKPIIPYWYQGPGDQEPLQELLGSPSPCTDPGQEQNIGPEYEQVEQPIPHENAGSRARVQGDPCHGAQMVNGRICIKGTLFASRQDRGLEDLLGFVHLDDPVHSQVQGSYNESRDSHPP